MFDALKARLARLRTVPETALEAAAPRVLARLRADATTRRGNVPSYGKMGDVPITVDVRANALDVAGPDWVMEKAKKLDQPAAWGEIVRQEGARLLRGGK